MGLLLPKVARILEKLPIHADTFGTFLIHMEFTGAAVFQEVEVLNAVVHMEDEQLTSIEGGCAGCG